MKAEMNPLQDDEGHEHQNKNQNWILECTKMPETGKLAQVTATMKVYNLHILGIGESRWTGSARYRTNTGEIVRYSGRDED